MPAAWEGPADGSITHREFRLWLDAHDRRHEIEETARHDQREVVQLALDKAERAMETRLASLNEFRGQLHDQAGTFVTRDVADARHSALDARMDGIGERIDRQVQALAAEVNKVRADPIDSPVGRSLVERANTNAKRIEEQHVRLELLEGWHDEMRGATSLARWALGASLLAAIISIITIVELITKAFE